MGTLHLVRHGQASFGAEDYDQLSALGARQCLALGQHYARRGVRFAGVLRGSLRRHQQSLAAFAEGFAEGAARGQGALPESQRAVAVDVEGFADKASAEKEAAWMNAERARDDVRWANNAGLRGVAL